MSHPSEDGPVVAPPPTLRSISPDATPAEVAAIVAALAESTRGGPVVADDAEPGLREWVRGTRLGARRTGLQRGPWRISGRIGRRSRT